VKPALRSKLMADEAPAPFDVVLLHGPTDDGAGTKIVRARPGKLEAGEIRPVREGQPINAGEVVTLKPREGAPRVCDVNVLHEAAAPQDVRGTGPAQVATRAYRDAWERIFGGEETNSDRALN
jgi:hypothetical protein